MVKAAVKFDAPLHQYVHVTMYGETTWILFGTEQNTRQGFMNRSKQTELLLFSTSHDRGDAAHVQVIHGDSMFFLWVGAKTLWRASWIVCLLPYLMVIFEDKSYIRWCSEQHRMFCEFNVFFGGEHKMLPWATSYVFVLFWVSGLLVLSGENIFVRCCREQHPICCRKRVNNN